MKELKVLFIDIDDVLLMHSGENKCEQFQETLDSHNDYMKAIEFYQSRFDKDHMSRIKELTEKNVKLVIHSTWRHYCELPQFKEMFKLYGINPDSVIGSCPVYYSESKRRGISTWLNENEPSHHAIIDNDDFYLHSDNPNFILINPNLGFDQEALSLVKVLLKIN